MSKIWRSIAIIGVVIALFAVIILNSSTKQSAADQVWNQAATVGDLESKNFYVMYTDLMCPYCDYFSRAVMDNQAEFEQYLADNNILFEVRLTDYLYLGKGEIVIAEPHLFAFWPVVVIIVVIIVGIQPDLVHLVEIFVPPLLGEKEGIQIQGGHGRGPVSAQLPGQVEEVGGGGGLPV